MLATDRLELNRDPIEDIRREGIKAKTGLLVDRARAVNYRLRDKSS